MEILITKKAKEQLSDISEEELLQLKEYIIETEYTGVSKGKLNDNRFFSVCDFYKWGKWLLWGLQKKIFLGDPSCVLKIAKLD